MHRPSEQRAVTSIAQALGKKYRLVLDDEEKIGVGSPTEETRYRCAKVGVDGMVVEEVDVVLGSNCKNEISAHLGVGIRTMVRIYPSPWPGCEVWWVGNAVADRDQLERSPLADVYQEFSAVRGPLVIRYMFGDLPRNVSALLSLRLAAMRDEKRRAEQLLHDHQDLPPPQSPPREMSPPPAVERPSSEPTSSNSMIYTVSHIYNSSTSGSDDEEEEEVVVSEEAAPRKATRIRISNGEQSDEDIPVARRRPRRKCRN